MDSLLIILTNNFAILNFAELDFKDYIHRLKKNCNSHMFFILFVCFVCLLFSFCYEIPFFIRTCCVSICLICKS